jgi:hypothetical protein
VFLAALAGSCDGILPAGSAVTAVAMTGRLRRPDGTNVSLSGTSSLTITTDTANLVSSKTVCFFCKSSDVSVTFTSL